ncbi:oligosaccharide flippase family protein [candidate division WWE3 bacterium]|uniref:Oligosaccharide flippase family protein n=1 Tax=candidate division WWE3 bacterium TaxID=2053526 RepID=A0A7X9DLL3_UNCKA|nr:oligosaccharide flippase family protein [candidate division WWE3 bacterium]
MRRLLANADLHGVMIVTVGTYIASFFSYLLQFFLGRLLSIEDYGLFNTYLAISYILGVPSYVLSTSLIKYVADLSGKNEFAQLSTMYRKFQILAASFGMLITILLVLLRLPISNYLKINDTYITVLYAFVTGFSYFIIVPFAYLQGFLRYRSYSLTNVASSFARFLLPVVLLYAGFGLPGVFAGMFMATIVAYVVSRTLLSRNLKELSTVNAVGEYSKLLSYSFPILFINLGLILLNNVDLIVVKRLFSSVEAGYYAGTVTLGKILLFGSSTVSSVMFPRVANYYAQKKPLLKVFSFFFFIQLLVVGIGTIVFSTLPGLLTNLFFGNKFSGSIGYLPGFSIFIGFYVLVNFLILFMMAIEKTYIFLFLLPAVLLQYFLLINSQSIKEVISINTFITSSVFFVLLVITAIVLYKKPQPKIG